MITVTICKSGFTVEGHADFKPKGEDIVCAAVSVLTQTALLGLGKYIPDTDYTIDDTGYLTCTLPEFEKWDVRVEMCTEAILKTMVLGLKNIEANYPECVKVKEDD